MIDYLFSGPPLEEGPLPALFYFALTAAESLESHPYNQVATHLANERLRVFSVDLPYHTPEADPTEALKRWTEPGLLPPFFDQVAALIDHLIKTNVIDPEHLATAGLSRGAFVATHIAALEPRVQTILGFAPLTDSSLHFDLPEGLALTHLVPKLIGRSLLFAIGNHDVQTGTRSCFEFIDALAKASHDSGLRSPPVEMVIRPSIGRHGHGTSPETFRLGADYLRGRLV